MNKDHLDTTYYFIVILIGLTCFGHYYAHHQELTTIMLIFVSYHNDAQSGTYQTVNGVNNWKNVTGKLQQTASDPNFLNLKA